MKHRSTWKSVLAGAAAGLTNGFFGGGGGSVLVPMLTRVWGGLDLSAALPYLIGGTVGGWAGGRLFKGVRLPWLKRGFGALLIWGGLRCLL